ncbi:hypothetical protein C8J57DRAFT_1524608 [Mycena rebaudengoi]|nr:hypothetical protein C8J57DRAFT_1524608 [Mycena rebaudengoi]
MYATVALHRPSPHSTPLLLQSNPTLEHCLPLPHASPDASKPEAFGEATDPEEAAAPSSPYADVPAAALQTTTTIFATMSPINATSLGGPTLQFSWQLVTSQYLNTWVAFRDHALVRSETAEIVAEAGFPPDVFHIVNNYCTIVGAAISGHPNSRYL